MVSNYYSIPNAMEARKKTSLSIIELLEENYILVLIGIFTILAIGYLLYIIFNRGIVPNSPNGSNTTINTKPAPTSEFKRYTVKKDDYLWKIAEETYGSGYNAYDIAAANNIRDPNIISEGDKLILPTVTPKPATTGEITEEAASTASSSAEITSPQNNRLYIVQQGDSLWTIALGAYGDGYVWRKIAAHNKLTNPDLIYSGDRLNLP